MDLEQLKLILEAAGAAGDGAETLAYWWLALQAFDSVLVFALLVVLFGGMYKLLKTL